MKRMGELSDAEVRAANVTAAETPSVLRQASYEVSRAERLHEDVTVELEVARQCWNASVHGSHLDGYIQQLGHYPFHVVCFTEQQILAGMGSRQFCRGRGRGRGREVEAEARQGSNVLNRGKTEAESSRPR